MSAVLTTRAKRFVRIGGRLLIDRRGNLHAAIGMQHLFGPGLSSEQARRRMSIARRITAAEQNRRRRAALTAIVRANGKRRPNGWTVWEGR